MVNKTRVIGATAVGIAIAFLCAPLASAATYSTTGSATQVSLGDTLGTGFDVLTISGASGALVDGGSIVLNNIAFTAGVNAITPTTYTGFSFTEYMTVDSGTPQQLTIPFNLSINYSDTLTIVGGTTVSFLDNGSLWQIVVQSLTIGPNSGGTMSANLMATVTDPPAGVSQVPLPGAPTSVCVGPWRNGLIFCLEEETQECESEFLGRFKILGTSL